MRVRVKAAGALCGSSLYSCNMTTATQYLPVPTRTAAPVRVTGTMDIDTRLTLASIYMDVILSRDPAVREARAAVAEAIADADRYAAEANRWEAVTAPPSVFKSHPILKRAGAIVRERGWHQGHWTSEQGAVCALAAIRLAMVTVPGREGDAVSVLLDRIRHSFGESSLSVPGWNDRQARTEGEVLSLLF